VAPEGKRVLVEFFARRGATRALPGGLLVPDSCATLLAVDGNYTAPDNIADILLAEGAPASVIAASLAFPPPPGESEPQPRRASLTFRPDSPCAGDTRFTSRGQIMTLVISREANCTADFGARFAFA
jgi:hypothetical protein